MHFNRTEFAAKTQIRLLALALLILMFLLSSCTEDIDLEEPPSHWKKCLRRNTIGLPQIWEVPTPMRKRLAWIQSDTTLYPFTKFFPTYNLIQ